jgi:5-(carboxyamino)imidazole ribonucleotide synthase
MRVGILGGGQLAQMLALAGIPLGIRFVCLEPQMSCSASSVSPIIQANFDESGITQLAEMVDVLTFESENIPTAALRNILMDSHLPLYPSIKALETAQDRLLEKQFFTRLNIPVAEFLQIDQVEDVYAALEKFGTPLLLKTRRQGYDGKGQLLVKTKEEAVAAFQTLSPNELIAEKWIAFDREVSLIAVRNQKGQIKFYPLTENVHQAGILRFSKAPFLDDALTLKAKNYLEVILTALEYVGVLSVEFFVYENELLVNEMAPRVHNSGHWTIEGAQTSQFENHLRAILNLPLGETDPLGYATMVNLIGELPPLEKLLETPDLHVHLYDKKPKKNRKLGHVTRISNISFPSEAL